MTLGLLRREAEKEVHKKPDLLWTCLHLISAYLVTRSLIPMESQNRTKALSPFDEPELRQTQKNVRKKPLHQLSQSIVYAMQNWKLWCTICRFGKSLDKFFSSAVSHQIKNRIVFEIKHFATSCRPSIIPARPILQISSFLWLFLLSFLAFFACFV